MRDKKRGTDNMSCVARIDDPVWLGKQAKRMSQELLQREHRGPGDTIEAAAYRLQTKHGCDASIILQGWQREPRDMLVSRWMSLFQAHSAAFAASAEAAYEERRKNTDVDSHPILVRLADFVAGRKDEAAKAEGSRQ